MSTNVRMCADVQNHCGRYEKSLRRLSDTCDSDDADQMIMESLSALEVVFAEFTGELCRVRLVLTNANGSAREYSLDSQTLAIQRGADAEVWNGSIQAYEAFRRLTNPACASTYVIGDNDAFEGEGLEVQSEGHDHAFVMAAVRGPMTSHVHRHDIVGVMSLEKRRGGFDDVVAKALVAFAYEMYFAVLSARDGMCADCLEPLSLK